MPLVPVYRRLTALCPALELDVAPSAARFGPGWTDGAALAADGAVLDAWLDAEAARIRDGHGRTARPDVVASRALHGYLWSAALTLSGPWYLHRRVPLITPGDLRIDPAAGTYGLVPGGFACLPDDPAARLPEARVVADEEALRAGLRAAVAGLVGPLLTALGPRVRRGPRALWGMAGDDLVSGVWHLGLALGDEAGAVAAASELLPGPVPPFPGGADFRRLTDHRGGGHLTRTRLGCCLYYTLQPADTCGTCPRLCDADRLRALTARTAPRDAVPHDPAPYDPEPFAPEPNGSEPYGSEPNGSERYDRAADDGAARPFAAAVSAGVRAPADGSR